MIATIVEMELESISIAGEWFWYDRNDCWTLFAAIVAVAAIIKKTAFRSEYLPHSWAHAKLMIVLMLSFPWLPF